MSRTVEYPLVTDQLLQEVVRRILSVGTPHTIVLFGSQARGDARPDSDLDLLIIEASDLPRYKRAAHTCGHSLAFFQLKMWWCGPQRKSRNGQQCPTPLSRPL